MGRQIVVSTKNMKKAGFERKVITVSEGYVCPDCGGNDFKCDYCYGNGHRQPEVRVVYDNGEISLTSYSSDNFCADCSFNGQNAKLFERLGLYKVKHSFC